MFNVSQKSKALLSITTTVALLAFASFADVATNKPVDLSKTKDLFAQPVQPNPLTSDPAAVLVRVNGAEITRGEILKKLDQMMQQYAGRVPPQQLQQMQSRLFDSVKNQLIMQKLLEEAVKADKIQVSDEEVTEAFNKIAEGFPSPAEFEKALAQSDVTPEEIKAELKDQLAIQKLLESKVANITDATEEEAKAFYDENPDKFKRPETVTASHILIKVEETDTEEIKAEKKAKLEKIRADIISGTNTFDKAAAEYSDCPSKARGGDLGTFEKGQMVPAFEAAAFSQEVDEVGDVIETRYGYHIIKVTAHQQAGVVPFDEAKEQIEKFLTNSKKKEVIDAYMKQLRDAATIEDLTAAPQEAAAQSEEK